MSEWVSIGKATLYLGDCREVLKQIEAASVDSIVTDPPYELGFMGKKWDASGIAYDQAVWRECLRVLKPGGHLLAFGGSRTYHRLACAIEDSGLEIRDQIQWVYGSGFPKSRDVSKDLDFRGGQQMGWFGPWLREWREKGGISQAALAEHFPSKTGRKTGRVSNFELGLRLPTPDDFNLICKILKLPFASLEEAEREMVGKKAGNPERFRGFVEQDGCERQTFNNDITAPATEAAKQWKGWGTALKPAHEPIVLARKPLVGTVAETVLRHGTGAINVDGCRVPALDGVPVFNNKGQDAATCYGDGLHGSNRTGEMDTTTGRWPANVLHDGSEEVLAGFPRTTSGSRNGEYQNGSFSTGTVSRSLIGDSGSAARFFYCAKASKADREAGNTHPTVKPTELMRYLCRLITPPGGTVLDPFMGSGSTLKAAIMEGFRCIGIEREAEYMAIAQSRIVTSDRQTTRSSSPPAKDEADKEQMTLAI